MGGNNRGYTFAATFIALLMLLAFFLSGALEGLSPRLRPAAVLADPNGIKYLGVGSCGGKGCHSEDIKTPKPPNDIAHDESVIWERFDLHARAHTDVLTKTKSKLKGLTTDRSKAIAQKLGIADATTSQRCLKCHALSGFSNGASKSRIELNYNTDLAPGEKQNNKFKESHGVSCDGCHGPSEKYLGPHQAKGWTQQQRTAIGGDKLFDQLGLYDTKNLRMRANACVSCHLKIDADLIKANHPELPFELDSFCHGPWMHWRPLGDYFGVKAWAMGQFVCMREAALQLSERIKAADKAGPDLVLDSYKQLAAHVIMSRHAAKLMAPELDSAIGMQMAALHDGWKDPAKATAALGVIAKTADALAEKLTPMKIDKAMTETLANDVATEGEAAGKKGFRSAQQYTFAMTALSEARFLQGAAPDPDRKAMDKKMEKLPEFMKLTALSDEIESDDKYKAATFIAVAQELMALFKGGQMIPLPPNPPDAGGAISMADPKPPVTPPDKPPVAPPDKPPVTPPDKPPVTPPDKPPVTPPDKPPVTPPDKPPVTPPDKPPVTPPDKPPVTPPDKPPVTQPDKPPVTPPDVNPPTPKEEYGKFIFCVECGRKNPPDYKYCPRCGHAMPRLEITP